MLGLLQTMIFGRKRPSRDDSDDAPPGILTATKPRAQDSYKRPLPNGDEVTLTKDHPIFACARYGDIRYSSVSTDVLQTTGYPAGLFDVV